MSCWKLDFCGSRYCTSAPRLSVTCCWASGARSLGGAAAAEVADAAARVALAADGEAIPPGAAGAGEPALATGALFAAGALFLLLLLLLQAMASAATASIMPVSSTGRRLPSCILPSPLFAAAGSPRVRSEKRLARAHLLCAPGPQQARSGRSGPSAAILLTLTLRRFPRADK